MDEVKTQKNNLPEIEVLEDNSTTTGFEGRVVLYNDDWHTFDEVIAQLIKAVHCSFEKARAHAFEVHIKGKSIVFKGTIRDCLKVSSILEEILLKTEIIA